jgi:long-chain acyl-CoA synthetase
MNVRQLLTNAQPLYTQHPLIVYNGETIGYEDFSNLVDRLSSAFVQLGVTSGDRVLILARNAPEWIAGYFAALGCGAIAVPVNPSLTLNEVNYIVEHAKPKIALIDEELQSALTGIIPHLMTLGPTGTLRQMSARCMPTKYIAECQATDPAVIFYTSGTTGRPKGVVLGHGAVIANARLVASLYRLSTSDKTLVSGSLSFIFSIMTNCTSAITAGTTIHLADRFHPEIVLRTIERERITIFMGVPTMFIMMLGWAKDKVVDVSSLRLCICSGASLPWNLFLSVKERFGISLYDLWGMTEGTPITSYDPFQDEPRPDSCGHALAGCGVRIVDAEGRDLGAETVGEVLLSGPTVMLGYYNNPEATAETLRNGWVTTGDLGKLDRDEYLSIVGRKKDLIIRGGANIYPTEVEDALYGHPAIAECAVIGFPHEIYGEIVKAVVVFKDGQHASADELTAHCRTLLADYKIPAVFEVLRELPKGPTGKILKRALKDRAATAA